MKKLSAIFNQMSSLEEVANYCYKHNLSFDVDVDSILVYSSDDESSGLEIKEVNGELVVNEVVLVEL